MSEAVDAPTFDILRTNVPQPAPHPIDERRRKIEERAAVLIAEEFARNPPKNAWWGDEEVAVRDRCFAQAQEEIAVAYGIEAWRPKGLDTDTVDWSLPPRQGLRLAINERHVAAEFRAKAGVVAARASDRLVALELELSQFRDLDKQVDEARLEAARTGEFDRDLPYGLSSALRDRDLCRDRLDHAPMEGATVAASTRSTASTVSQSTQVPGICTTSVSRAAWSLGRAVTVAGRK
jgi:hypothetical protein